jgi:predicted kinase
MAGDPGSGKSTLAREIGKETGAVVLDKDIVKSAALRAGADEAVAGPLAYEAQFALARSMLGQGHSVILDSPAYFTRIRETGRRIAREYGAIYCIIECVADRELVISRLSARERTLSQPDQPIIAPYARDGAAPLSEPHLTVDMTRPLDECTREALDYIGRKP